MKGKRNEPNIDNDSDSDGAPDEVTFKEGLEQMLEAKKNISKKVEEQKEKLKQKRRRQEELFIEQKKLKLAKLESMKLPEEFLEQINDEPIKEKDEKTENSERHSTTAMAMNKCDDVENDEVDEDNDDVADSEDDTVPQRQTGIIAIHNKPPSKITPASEKARDFKNNALFGPAAKRQSIKSFLGTREKRKFRK